MIPVLSPQSLGYAARVIETFERRATRNTDEERLLADTCLTLSYDWIAGRFFAAGYSVIGKEASKRSEKHRKAASERFASLRKQHGKHLGKRMESRLDHWTLIALRESADVLFEMESHADPASTLDPISYYAQDSRARALLVVPETAQRLFELAPELSLDRRLQIIGAIASLELMDVDLDIPKDSLIGRAYAAYRDTVEISRKRDVTLVESLDGWLDVLRALGATDSELRERKKQMDELRKRWKKLRRMD